jgi:hypothetical protein
VTRAARAALVACVVLGAAACGGDDGAFAAKVGDATVSVEDVRRAALALSAEREREGKPPIEEGTQEFRRLEQQILGVLVHRARLEQEADELGIDVRSDEIEERMEEAEAGGEEEGEDERFIADQVRASLVEEKLFTHITGNVRVSDAEVRAHFENNARTLYRGRTFESLRDTIRVQLLGAARNIAWIEWLEQVEREYASKIEYGEGYLPAA